MDPVTTGWEDIQPMVEIEGFDGVLKRAPGRWSQSQEPRLAYKAAYDLAKLLTLEGYSVRLGGMRVKAYYGPGYDTIAWDDNDQLVPYAE